MLINSLALKNFKCFEELDVKFAPITLLTGANSSGKSSLINAILAVLQTESFPLYLSPNGKYLNMGSYEEMIWWGSIDKEITIGLDTTWGYFDSKAGSVVEEDNKCSKSVWGINSQNGLPILQEIQISSEYLYQKLKIIKTGNTLYEAELEYRVEDDSEGKRLLETEKIQIDSIDQLRHIHLGPKDIDGFSDIENYYQKLIAPDFNYIGSFRQVPVRTYYQKPKATNKVSVEGEGYIDQIVEWEETGSWEFGELIRSLKKLELVDNLKTEKMKGGRFELNVKVQQKANFSSLTDVGFGVSQFLPIMVANLQLSEHSCLAISQPEIHLHPKIQAQFGSYLADQIRRTQKQYIVETHSEYLLNRIRLLLVTGELKPEDVRVLYFENDGVKSTVHDIEFATDGQIKGAPQGFFDTYGIDVMNIAMNAIA